MYNFHDAKLWGLEFNFDATDSSDQNLILDLDYLIQQKWNEQDTLINYLCPCKLIFKNVSGFSINFSTEYVGLNPLNYQADSVYVLSIDMQKQDSKHQLWRLNFVGDYGNMEISCDDVELKINKEFTITVENEVYIPREIREKLIQHT